MTMTVWRVALSLLTLASLFSAFWAMPLGHDPKFGVEFVFSRPEVEPPDSELVPMRLAEGDRFDCYIPRVEEEPHPVATSRPDTAESWEERAQILNAIIGSFYGTCHFRVAGWWIYELCFNKHVRQFHQETRRNGAVEITAQFFLGLRDGAHAVDRPPFPPSHQQDNTESSQQPYSSLSFPESEEMEELFPPIHDAPFPYVLRRPRKQHATTASGEKIEPYLSFTWGEGTKCDLSGTPRQIEIRMFCARPDSDIYQALNSIQPPVPAMITSLEEIKTCQYRLVFHTTRLCRHPDFIVEKEPLHTIRCFSHNATTSIALLNNNIINDSVLNTKFNDTPHTDPPISENPLPPSADNDDDDDEDTNSIGDDEDAQRTCPRPNEERTCPRPNFRDL